MRSMILTRLPRLRNHAERALQPAVAALVLLALVAIALLLFEGRSFTFQNDEWDWLLHRRGHSLGVFLKPHGEHLSTLPILAYKLLFQLFGARSTFPFRLLDALLVGVCAALLFVFVARRLGGWVALAPAAVLLFLGPGWNDTLWGFQIGYMASLATGLGALLALERTDKPGDITACVLLTIALASSSVGLTVLVGAFVGVALAARASGWRRVWVVVVPAVLYGLWYSRYGVSSVQLSHAHMIPLYAFQGLSAVAGSVTGLTEPAAGSPYDAMLEPGMTIAVLLLAAFAARLLRDGLPARFWTAAATALAFWSAAALSYIPGREPNSSRYIFAVVPFVIIAVVECCVGCRPGRRGIILLYVGSLAAIASNLGFLQAGARLFDQTSQYARAELGAMEVARDLVSPSFLPEDPSITPIIGIHNMIPIDARSYFSAVDAFGSPADGVAAILRQPDRVRQASDLVLARAERLELHPARSPTRGCHSQQPVGGGIDLTSGPGVIVVRPSRAQAPHVALRRFADAYNFVVLGPVAPGTVSVDLPHDRSSLPWHIRVLTAAPVVLCAGS